MRLLTSFLQKLISMNFFLLNTVKEGELSLPFVKVIVLGAENLRLSLLLLCYDN